MHGFSLFIFNIFAEKLNQKAKSNIDKDKKIATS